MEDSGRPSHESLTERTYSEPLTCSWTTPQTSCLVPLWTAARPGPSYPAGSWRWAPGTGPRLRGTPDRRPPCRAPTPAPAASWSQSPAPAGTAGCSSDTAAGWCTTGRAYPVAWGPCPPAACLHWRGRSLPPPPPSCYWVWRCWSDWPDLPVRLRVCCDEIGVDLLLFFSRFSNAGTCGNGGCSRRLPVALAEGVIRCHSSFTRKSGVLVMIHNCSIIQQRLTG